MVSTTMTVAIMAIAAACFIIVAHANLGPKCKFDMEQLTEEEQTFIAECYEEVTGKPMTKDSGKQKLSDTDKEKMCLCVVEKMGLMSADGQFNAEKVKAEVVRIETDEETKEAIRAGIDACGKAGSESQAIHECLKNVFEKECGE